MSNIVPFNPQGQAPAALARDLAARQNLPSAFTQGIGAGYANVSFKGKVFQIRYNGQVTHLVDPQTNAPMQYFDVILIDAKQELSKTYYAGAYAEGDNAAPDCSSEDGIHPTAPAGKQVMCHDCRVCPMNAFGSKVSTDGRATNSKACQDTRKVAIVPSFNIRNENFGGAMLLRIPPDSLKGLAQYVRGLEAQGATHNAVVTRIMFDYTVSHPKLTFQAARWVNDDEYNQIKEIQASSGTQDIISSQAPQQAAQLPAPVQAIPGQAPSGMQQAPVSQAPVATSAPAPGYAQQPAPAAPQPQQTFSPPPQQAPAPQAPQAAPGVPGNPTSIQSSFPQQPQMNNAPQQAPVMQPPPQQYAPQMTQAAPAPQPTMQPPPQAYAPQMTAAAPQPGYAPQPQQPTFQAPGAPTQAPPQQGAPLPQSVISGIDTLLG